MAGALDGRLALVTGASRGIGAATAEALAAAGAHVILVARTAKDLEIVEERIHAAGGAATIAPLDLTQSDAIARLAQAAGQRWPALDFLVLNAATLGTLTPVIQIDGKELNEVLTLNLLAQHALIAAFDPMLRASAAGRLVVLTSSVGQAPRPYWGSYAASKAALEVIALTYSQEVENISNIRVAIVNPGATRTAMRAKAYPGEDPAEQKAPAAVAAALLDLVVQDFETGHRLTLA
jgi:NAD(P)-dependent dehydrogenase (short-subunit alcohol dehydrogenase family)